jgi:LIVCS family branched-chain amino acid:cation transporter
MNKNIITTGFAVFAMFFGAGNMVLPLHLMQEWHNHWFSAFIGFCVTAVFFTLLGLIGSVLVQGDIKRFFAPLGVTLGLGMQVILIIIEGPFGIVPRSLIVSYGGVLNVWPNLNQEVFYFLSCVAIYFLALNKNRIIKVIGNILTPAMLIFLIIIVLSCYITYGVKGINFELNNSQAFTDGMFKGYLTYDLPGALYFTTIAMVYLTAISKNKDEILSNGIKSSFISAILLSTVYALFIYLGLSYRELLQDVPPELILPTIVKGSLGQGFSAIFACLIFLACITTAIAAITVWSDFIHSYFPKLNYKLILIVSLTISFIVSSIGFSSLMSLLGPVLNIVYPILIGLTVYNIVIYCRKDKKELANTAEQLEI